MRARCGLARLGFPPPVPLLGGVGVDVGVPGLLLRCFAADVGRLPLAKRLILLAR